MHTIFPHIILREILLEPFLYLFVLLFLKGINALVLLLLFFLSKFLSMVYSLFIHFVWRLLLQCHSFRVPHICCFELRNSLADEPNRLREFIYTSCWFSVSVLPQVQDILEQCES